MFNELSPEENLLLDIMITKLVGHSGVVNQIVIHNDDHNTVDHVAQTLIELFGFDPHKAVEVTMRIHHLGLSGIVVGEREELVPLLAELAIAGLDAEIV